MRNVVLLFANDGPIPALDPQLPLDEAVVEMMWTSACLARRLNDLCSHLDTVDQLIDQLGDGALRRSLRDQTRDGRQALSEAMLELQDELRELPSLRRRAAAHLARR